MKSIAFLMSYVLETLFRVLPVPCRPGLIRIGHPTRNSPVFLTGNFHLTVQKVKRALTGIDAYLLVANSHGINVWCGSAGGHFTNHDVISSLKTSGIEDLVDQRTVILPQLAAAGLEAKAIKERTGWEIIWGPVYAQDIPSFLKNGLNKEPAMRQVKFPWPHRLEMAAAWASPISLVFFLFLIFLWPSGILPAVALIWGLSLILFLAFPVYGPLLSSKGRRIGFIFFDFGRGGFQLIIFAILLICLFAYSFFLRSFSWDFFIHWGILLFMIVLVLSIDLKGSTPLYKSSLHEERLYRIFIDRGKCWGVGACQDVCPRNCYFIDTKYNKVKMPGVARCVACGACIIQCPNDALRFRGPNGKEIFPEMIRKYKLDIFGKRLKSRK